jgi:hypothetical protein
MPLLGSIWKKKRLVSIGRGNQVLRQQLNVGWMTAKTRRRKGKKEWNLKILSKLSQHAPGLAPWEDHFPMFGTNQVANFQGPEK